MHEHSLFGRHPIENLERHSVSTALDAIAISKAVTLHRDRWLPFMYKSLANNDGFAVTGCVTTPIWRAGCGIEKRFDLTVDRQTVIVLWDEIQGWIRG